MSGLGKRSRGLHRYLCALGEEVVKMCVKRWTSSVGKGGF